MDKAYGVLENKNATSSDLYNEYLALESTPVPEFPRITDYMNKHKEDVMVLRTDGLWKTKVGERTVFYDNNDSYVHAVLNRDVVNNYIGELSKEYYFLHFSLKHKYEDLEYFKKKEQEEKLRKEREALEEKRIAEDKKFHLTNFNVLSAQISELHKKFNQLDYDVKQGNLDKEKEFSLFKSEITSVIPAQDMNVSRVEHDEDIAQLNDTIASLQKKVDMSQRELNETYRGLSKMQNAILRDTSLEDHKMSVRIDNQSEAIRETNKRVKNQEENLRNTNTVIQNNSAQIAGLREDLQALGGKTKEFIDNTKRREQVVKAKVAKKESVVTRTVKKAAFPDLTKRPWLGQSVTGRFFQLVNQW